MMTHTPTPWYVNGFWARSDDRERAGRIAKAEIAFKDSLTCADNIDRVVACVNFFHGRDVPTERIEEGGLWEMVDLLQQFAKGGDTHYEQEYARALLTKLGVEP